MIWLALACAPKEPPPLVLVAIDNVRWDHTSLAGGADYTPSLRELAELPGSVTFTNAYAAAPFSLASYTSLFTGKDAPHHGVGFSSMVVPPAETTLAEALSANGWRCAAFTGGAEVSHDTGLEQGFDPFDDGPPISPLSRSANAALTWLDSGPKRPFLFIHGYDAHIPYSSPPLMAERYDPAYTGPVHQGMGLLTIPALASIEDGKLGGNPAAFTRYGAPAPPPFALSEADIRHIGAHYSAAVRKGDYALGSLLRTFEARGLLDEAVLVVLADHGEELGEHGAFQHGNSLDDVVLHVPVVVHLPGSRAAPRRVDSLVSLVDLAPTLLDLLGVAPMAGVDGRSLRPLLDGGSLPDRAVRAATHHRYALRTPEWWLGAALSPTGPTWTLRAGGVADDVSAANPDVVTRLAAQLGDWPSDPGDAVLGGSDALRATLRDAGYWNVTGKP